MKMSVKESRAGGTVPAPGTVIGKVNEDALPATL